MSIRHISLNHGWFYHYRLHELKISDLCSNGFSSLKSYLEGIFDHCPDEMFSTTLRSSSLRMDLNIKPTGVGGHEVSKLAGMALEWNKYRTAHSNVQVFMLQNDTSTLGVEVPIWMTSEEIECYKRLFNTDEALSGHIDVLRLEDGKIWVWDYKPNAHKEKYATTQVYFYALMLSKRTGIPLSKFMCGYFDENTAFVFKPKMELLERAG
ncbi:MAG: PD-(D/E)XK nuclease family protein [Nanoarchaeota archaeon]|nr:PD-(D/E)XK nuclease family protein [Nanoarchaeota archaeon]